MKQQKKDNCTLFATLSNPLSLNPFSIPSPTQLLLWQEMGRRWVGVDKEMVLIGSVLRRSEKMGGSGGCEGWIVWG